MDTGSKAEELKIKGNEAFKTGDYTGAVSLSQAYLKLERWSLAESDATKALNVDPKNIKAFYRRALARREQRNFVGAWEDIQLFSEVGGETSVSKSELAKICGFEVVDTGVKGLGVFALQEFSRGDLIITEALLFSVQNDYDQQGNREFTREAIEDPIIALAPEKRQKFEKLENTLPREGILGIYATNAFQLESMSGVFLQCSRFNHSCSPNAKFSWNAEIKRIVIYALRDIARGDEILVSYMSGIDAYGRTRAQRQARLQKRGFTCNCAACTLPQPEMKASDDRRARVNEIYESIPKLPRDQSLQLLLAIADAIHLLKEDGYAADYDEFTNYAAQVCAFHSDWASAKYWATETYKTTVAEYGEDSDTAKEAKKIFVDPKTVERAGTGPQKMFEVRL